MSLPQSSVVDHPSSITEIYIVGAASTGKTTLCHALFTRLGLQGPEFIKEAARDVMTSKGYTRNDVPMLEMQIDIMTEQLSREIGSRIAAAASGRVLLSDRSAIDPIVYAIITSASVEEAEQRVQILTDSDRFRMALAAYKRSLFILLAPVPEWLEDDGIRKIDDQDHCHDTFREMLNRLEIEFHEIGSEMRSLGERAETVIRLARIVR